MAEEPVNNTEQTAEQPAEKVEEQKAVAKHSLCLTGYLTISNMMSLVCGTKQNADSNLDWEQLLVHEKAKILTDLYYTIPSFDLGIVEATEKLVCKNESSSLSRVSCSPLTSFRMRS